MKFYALPSGGWASGQTVPEGFREINESQVQQLNAAAEAQIAKGIADGDAALAERFALVAAAVGDEAAEAIFGTRPSPRQEREARRNPTNPTDGQRPQ